MLVLRADPWRPEFGADVEALLEDREERAGVMVDPTVERSDWSTAIESPPASPQVITFVDGVRRVDLRVLADEDGRRCWGLLGSFAVGAVRCEERAVIEEPRVERALVLGGGLRGETVTVRVGPSVLEWHPHATAGDSPLAALQALQNLMRRAEGGLAADLAATGTVVADGPLHYPFGPDAVVVGVAKRMVATYLEPEHGALLTRLRPGQRTPLFALGRQALDRYAWYQRLVELREPWHDLAGIVRCEVRMELGIDAARDTADRTAALLPRYAGRPGLDPRAPQNMTPVSALESRLRHLLGHPTAVRRALQDHLAVAA